MPHRNPPETSLEAAHFLTRLGPVSHLTRPFSHFMARKPVVTNGLIVCEFESESKKNLRTVRRHLNRSIAQRYDNGRARLTSDRALFDFLTLPCHALCACSVAAPAAARFEIEADRFVAAERSLFAWQGGLVAELNALQAAWSGLDGVLLAIWATWGQSSTHNVSGTIKKHRASVGLLGPMSRTAFWKTILTRSIDKRSATHSRPD